MSDAEEPLAGTLSDDDLGEPVTELQRLSLSVDERFGKRVRGGIERRVLAGHVLDLLWTGPIAVFVEFVEFAFGFTRTRRRP